MAHKWTIVDNLAHASNPLTCTCNVFPITVVWMPITSTLYVHVHVSQCVLVHNYNHTFMTEFGNFTITF